MLYTDTNVYIGYVCACVCVYILCVGYRVCVCVCVRARVSVTSGRKGAKTGTRIPTEKRNLNVQGSFRRLDFACLSLLSH